MPIDLISSPESSGSSGRRRRRRNKHRNHIIYAVLTGFGLLAIVGGVLALNHSGPWFQRSTQTLTQTGDSPPGPRPQPGPTTEDLNSPPESKSVAALSSGELAPDKTHGRLLKLRRLRGANYDKLELEYEFTDLKKNPLDYVIAGSSPSNPGIALARFKVDASDRDTVELPHALEQLGNQGPIRLWLQLAHSNGTRVSNYLEIP